MKLKKCLVLISLSFFIFFDLSIKKTFSNDNPLNVFRKDPLSFSYILGKDPEDLKKYWPENLWQQIKRGLENIKISEKLNIIAKKRVEEILDISLPLEEGIKKDKLKDLFNEIGYDYVLFEESIALLAFENPISEEEALNILFKMLLINALENKDNGVSILFPCWDEMGYFFKYGQVNYDENLYYAAVLEIIFAIPKNSNKKIIVGKITDQHGNPIRSAKIEIRNEYNKQNIITETFGNGLYCIENYKYKIGLFEIRKEEFKTKKLFKFISQYPYRFDFSLQENE